MPVRVQVPLRVLKKSESESESEHSRSFFHALALILTAIFPEMTWSGSSTSLFRIQDQTDNSLYKIIDLEKRH